MKSIPYRPTCWATHLVSALVAALVSVTVVCPAAAAATQPVAEAPQAIFVLPARPSELLRAPESSWKPLLAQVNAALDERSGAADLLGKPALVELNIQRTVVAQMQRDWKLVLDGVGKSRQLQDSEPGRQTAGLLNEVLALQAISGGDAAWLQQHVREQVLSMRWEEVEPTVRALRQQLALAKPEAIESFVANKLDLSASAAENKATLGFVVQLMAMRFQLLEVMPRQAALIAGLDAAIAERSADAADAAGK